MQGVNFDTDEGRQLKKQLLSRLDELKNRLESPELTERDTAVTRGAIGEIKRLLSVAPPHVAPLRYSGNHQGGFA
jgi:hypothetical protein